MSLAEVLLYIHRNRRFIGDGIKDVLSAVQFMYLVTIYSHARLSVAARDSGPCWVHATSFGC